MRTLARHLSIRNRKQLGNVLNLWHNAFSVAARVHLADSFQVTPTTGDNSMVGGPSGFVLAPASSSDASTEQL